MRPGGTTSSGSFSGSQAKGLMHSHRPGPVASEGSLAVLCIEFPDETDKAIPSRESGNQLAPPHAAQEAVSFLVQEFGGTLWNPSQSPIVACFSNDKEALKSAVRIQQRMGSPYAGGSGQGKTEARIGIHSGRAPADPNKTHDFIRIASKLSSFAAPSQILVSQSVYDTTCDLPAVHFEPVNIWHKTDFLDGSAIFRVTWDRAADFLPTMNVVLYFRPLFNLGDNSFPEVWRHMIKEGVTIWGKDAEKEEVGQDETLAVVLKNHKPPLPVIRKVFTFLRDKLRKGNGEAYLPLYVLVDVRPSAGEIGIGAESPGLPLGEVRPGDAYVSVNAHRAIRGWADIPIIAEENPNPSPSWHKISWEAEGPGGEAGFLYRGVLARGTKSACFYCGGRQHAPGNCPSKQLSEITHTMESLGYLSLKNLNRLFLEFFTTEGSDPEGLRRDIMEGRHPHLDLPFYAFYEINEVFQLRFFKAVWHSRSDKWSRTWRPRNEVIGGLAWLAHDSLRVSDLSKAEFILREAQIRHPEDYRVSLIGGYLSLEKENLDEAEYFFKKALKYAKADSSKMLVFFLLSRLYKLLGRNDSAQKSNDEILLLDPHCPEALYQDVKYRMQQGNVKGAIRRLSVLVSDEREHFLYALLDPELEPFQEEVNNQLLAVFNKAKADAESVVASVEAELTNSRSLMQEHDLRKVEELRSKIENLLMSESYFGYLDVIQLGNRIISTCQNSIKERRKEVRRLLEELAGRAARYIYFVSNYSFPRLVQSYHKRLEQIRLRIASAMDAPQPVSQEEFKAIEILDNEVSSEFDHLESEFSKLEIVGLVLINAFKFVRNSIILMAAVFLIGIFLLPAVVHYVNVTFSDFQIGSASDVWMYQKVFITVGGGGSLVTSFLIAVWNLFKGTGATVREK